MSGTVFERLRDWLWPAPSADLSLASPRSAAGFLPDGLRVYAIGDIHGEAGLLDRLARKIEIDLARHRPETAEVVFLGDYIDRGPDSRGVIERLASRDFPFPFTALRGNHEDLMLQALEAPDAMASWSHVGGIETLRSYGLDAAETLKGKGLSKWREAMIDRLPPSHRAFLESTLLSRTIGGYFFVHAGARPGVPLDRQEERDLLWIREECYASSHDFGRVLVHGHTPHKQPENLARRINVDTGAFKWGVLTAVVLEGSTRRFLSSGD